MAEEKEEVGVEPVGYSSALRDAITAAVGESEEKTNPEPTKEPKAAKVEERESEPKEVASEEDTPEESEGIPEEQSETGESEPEEASDEIEAPSNWSEEERRMFSGLDKDVKAFYLKRSKDLEAGFTRRQQELAEKERQLAPFANVLQRAQGMIPQGTDPARAVQSALGAVARFNRDPVGTIRQLAAAKGIDLVDVALSSDSSSQNQQQPTPDQIAAHVRQQIHHEQAQQQQATYAQQIRAELQNTEKYPHLNEIGQDVLAQAHAVRAMNPNMPPVQILEEAYQRALRANPDQYNKALEQAKKEALEAERKRIASETEKAKKAGKPVRDKTAGSNPSKVQSGKLSIRDAIALAEEKSSNR